MKRLRVGVIYGGRSGEHEVSLASAAAVCRHLDPARYDILPILIARNGRWTLPERPPAADSAAAVIAEEAADAPAGRDRSVHLVAHPGASCLLVLEGAGRDGSESGAGTVVSELALDVVFPVLHGPYGEDGTIQGLLELANVPYVGAGVLASALAMDKAMAKVVFAAHGLPIAEYVVVQRHAWRADRQGVVSSVLRRFDLPVFVKPANLGSSVGISKARTRQQVEDALDLAADFDRRVLVEAAVPDAREIECGVLGNERPATSVIGEIVPSREFYDYEAKYLDDGSRPLIPAPLSTTETADVERLALEAYRAIDCAGMARVDFLMARATGRLVVNEINTIPGFTTISMYAKLWAASGVNYPSLLDRLIALALERHADRQQLRTSAS